MKAMNGDDSASSGLVASGEAVASNSSDEDDASSSESSSTSSEESKEERAAQTRKGKGVTIGGTKTGTKKATAAPRSNNDEGDVSSVTTR